MTFPSRHIVSVSSGLGSAFAWKLWCDRYGPENVTGVFTDVNGEHPDNYRFLAETQYALGSRLVKITNDGRTIWDVMCEQRFLANTRVDTCSKYLKRIAMKDWLDANVDPTNTVIALGIDWTEMHRFDRARPRWAADGYTIAAPLCEPPYRHKSEAQGWLDAEGIARPALYDMGFSHANCFAAETRFITDQGMKTLKECADSTVRVIGAGRGNAWTDATIKAFGVQQLWRVKATRYGVTREWFATADHRWFIRRGRTHKHERMTAELSPGDRLWSVTSKLRHNVVPSPQGIGHGIVFGDGTAPITGQPTRLMLVGDRNEPLLRWFPNNRTNESPIGVVVSDLPRGWKQPPAKDESASYLYGFLAGWFAADGSVTGGECRLSTARSDDVQLALDLCARLGLGTNPVRVEQRIGLGVEPTPLYTIPIDPRGLTEAFFLLPGHLERWQSISTERRAAEWVVASVEATDRVEEVFCAVVPEGHAFTLEGMVLTGNCGGGCVKAGIKQFKHLLAADRRWYMRWWEAGEERVRRHLGRDDIAILRDRRGGVTRPFTLRQLREEVDADAAGTLFEDEPEEQGCGVCFLEPEDEAA